VRARTQVDYLKVMRRRAPDARAAPRCCFARRPSVAAVRPVALVGLFLVLGQPKPDPALWPRDRQRDTREMSCLTSRRRRTY